MRLVPKVKALMWAQVGCLEVVYGCIYIGTHTWTKQDLANRSDQLILEVPSTWCSMDL